MSTLDKIATKIIKEQELIIGPIALEEAGKVSGLNILNKNTGEVSINTSENGKIVIDNLVTQYEHFFGLASREVCREAVASLVAELPKDEVPSSLK